MKSKLPSHIRAQASFLLGAILWMIVLFVGTRCMTALGLM